MQCKVIGTKQVLCGDGQLHTVTIYSAPEPPDPKTIIWPNRFGGDIAHRPFDWYDDSRCGQD